MDDAIHHAEAALRALGFTEDPEMQASGRRFVEFLAEFMPGPRPHLSGFAVDGSGPVVLKGMAFHSLCAHHLVPFFGEASVAYLPGATVAGLGGIARMLHHFARQPQLQERLAEQLADALAEDLAPRGLVVRLTARQMCMEMRGARTRAEVVVLARRGDDQGLVQLL